jgi:hypothetical protein
MEALRSFALAGSEIGMAEEMFEQYGAESSNASDRTTERAVRERLSTAAQSRTILRLYLVNCARKE